MLVRARNTLDTTALSSNLTNNTAIGASTLPVQNINSFSASWAVQLGRTKEENAEIVVLGTATPSGTALALSGTARYAHNIDTPVYATKFDKIIFKRSTAGTSGTATAMTNGTVTITPDSEYTQFDDTTALSTYAYKAAYYNSVTVEVSSDSDWITPTGFSFYSLAKLRQRSKDAIYNAGYIKSDEVIDDWINEWQEQMGNSAIKVNESYALGTVGVAFDGSVGLGTITEADFKSVRKFEVVYTGGASYVPTDEIPVNSFADSDSFTSVYPKHYWRGDDVFGIKPYSNGGTARITYSKIYANLANDTDLLSLVLRPYTSGCIEYVLYRAYGNDDKNDAAEAHFGKFKIAKQDFISEITPAPKRGKAY